MTLEPVQSPEDEIPDEMPDLEPADPIKAALGRLNNAEKKAEMMAAIASGQALFERGRY